MNVFNLITMDEAKVKLMGRKGALHLIALQHMTLAYIVSLGVRPDLALAQTAAYFTGVAGLALSFGVTNTGEHFAKRGKEDAPPPSANQ